MDIITTGQTKTSAERLKVICDHVKQLTGAYGEKIKKDGLKYSNLLDYLTQKAEEGIFKIGLPDEQTKDSITEKEYREVLKTLEDDGYVSLIGHQSCPVIRFLN